MPQRQIACVGPFTMSGTKKKKKKSILMWVNKAAWRMDNERWMASNREVTNKNTKRNNIELNPTIKQDLDGILVVTNLLYLKL